MRGSSADQPGQRRIALEQPSARGDAVAPEHEARADLVLQGGQVEAQHEVPDEAGLVLGLQEVLQGHARDELLAIGAAQPRRRAG